jgi:tetratricopeptide (TPR) repeat protein
MDLPSSDALLSELDERLRRAHGVALHLETGAPSGSTPREALLAARRAVVARTAELQAAVAELGTMVERLRRLAALAPFSEAGWPERREQLERKLGDDPSAGLAAWLEDYYMAQAGVRTEAVGRLLTLAPQLPPGTAVLVERCASTAAALAGRLWGPGAPLLRAGVRGVAVGDRSVPRRPCRVDVALLLGRLALLEGELDAAEEVLSAAPAERDSPGLAALQARLERMRGGDGSAIEDVASRAPTDLDVCLEVMAHLRSVPAEERAAEADPLADEALLAARSAVDGLLSLDDLASELERRLEPIPARIYLAVGERALRQEDRALAIVALAAAASAVDPSEHALAASISERRAEVAADDHDRARILLGAGKDWERAGQPARARGCYEAVHALEPDDVEATLRLADVLWVLSGSGPEELSRVQAALDLVTEAQAAGPLPPELSWGYLTEAVCRSRIADLIASPPDDQQWRALLAALRAVALQPRVAGRWVRAARCASGVRLLAVAEALSAESVRLDPSSENVLFHVDRLVALDDRPGALEELDRLVAADPGVDRVTAEVSRASILLAGGQTAEAATLLLGITDLSPWGEILLLFALTVLGRHEQARTMAERVTRAQLEHRGEPWAMALFGLAGLVTGRLDEADQFGRQMVDRADPNGHYLTGAAALLQGDEARGVQELAAYVDGFDSQHEVWELFHTELPFLRALLAREGRGDAVLVQVESQAEAGRSALAGRPSPGAEVAAADPSGVDPDVVARVRVLALALVADAEGDAGAEPDGAVARALAPELEALRSARAGAAPSEEAAGPPMAPAGEPDEPPAGDEPPVVLHLPPSWFADLADPLVQHPLFTRYLPELRLRDPDRLPPVSVRTDATLEPDGYRIEMAGAVGEAGRVPVGFWYLAAPALPLLTPEIRDAAEPAPDLHLFDTDVVRVPSALVEDPGLAVLLAVEPAEAVARRLALVVTETAPVG